MRKHIVMPPELRDRLWPQSEWAPLSTIEEARFTNDPNSIFPYAYYPRDAQDGDRIDMVRGFRDKIIEKEAREEAGKAQFTNQGSTQPVAALEYIPSTFPAANRQAAPRRTKLLEASTDGIGSDMTTMSSTLPRSRSHQSRRPSDLATQQITSAGDDESTASTNARIAKIREAGKAAHASSAPLKSSTLQPAIQAFMSTASTSRRDSSSSSSNWQKHSYPVVVVPPPSFHASPPVRLAQDTNRARNETEPSSYSCPGTSSVSLRPLGHRIANANLLPDDPKLLSPSPHEVEVNSSEESWFPSSLDSSPIASSSSDDSEVEIIHSARRRVDYVRSGMTLRSIANIASEHPRPSQSVAKPTPSAASLFINPVTQQPVYQPFLARTHPPSNTRFDPGPSQTYPLNRVTNKGPFTFSQHDQVACFDKDTQRWEMMLASWVMDGQVTRIRAVDGSGGMIFRDPAESFTAIVPLSVLPEWIWEPANARSETAHSSSTAIATQPHVTKQKKLPRSARARDFDTPPSSPAVIEGGALSRLTTTIDAPAIATQASDGLSPILTSTFAVGGFHAIATEPSVDTQKKRNKKRRKTRESSQHEVAKFTNPVDSTGPVVSTDLIDSTDAVLAIDPADSIRITAGAGSKSCKRKHSAIAPDQLLKTAGASTMLLTPTQTSPPASVSPGIAVPQANRPTSSSSQLARVPLPDQDFVYLQHFKQKQMDDKAEQAVRKAEEARQKAEQAHQHAEHARQQADLAHRNAEQDARPDPTQYRLGPGPRKLSEYYRQPTNTLRRRGNRRPPDLQPAIDHPSVDPVVDTPPHPQVALNAGHQPSHQSCSPNNALLSSQEADRQTTALRAEQLQAAQQFASRIREQAAASGVAVDQAKLDAAILMINSIDFSAGPTPS